SRSGHELYGESRPALLSRSSCSATFAFDGASVLIDDSVADEKTQARTLAFGFRRKKRFEYQFEVLLGDAAALVLYLNDGLAAFFIEMGSNLETPPFMHGGHGIVDQV